MNTRSLHHSLLLFLSTAFTLSSISPVMAQTLADSLESRKSAFLQKAPQEKIDLYEQGISELEASGILQSAIQVGQKAPDFTLFNAIDNPIKLSELLEQGPVVLAWYRGGWCPYCNIQLHYLQQQLPAIKAAGGQLIALTPEMPDKSLSTAEKHDLEFEVLSDFGNKVAADYGIVFTLSPELQAAYSKSFDMVEYNGDDSYSLPLAATYVIDTNGTVIYAYLDADYRRRAEPAAIIEALKNR